MRISILKWCLSGFLLTFLGQAGAAPQIDSFQARYQLNRSGLPFGHVEVSFQLDSQGHYRYSAKTRLNKFVALLHTYSISEMSQGVIEEGRFVPQQYFYHSEKSEQERIIQLSFDWQKRRVRTATNDSPWSMRIPMGTQDKLSQQLAIQLALIGGENTASFDVADGGRLKRYHYTSEGIEKLQTALGELTTIRVKRSKQALADYTIWFAPSLNYLPIRFEREQPDGRFVMELLSLR